VIAHAFAQALSADGHQVVAVGSRSRARARQFATEHGIARAYGSYEELCGDPGVDILYVATPHVFHLENALMALDNGKHVLIEKPIAMNAQQAATIATRALETGLVAMEAMRTRFLPHMAEVRRIVESGALGEVRAVHATMMHNSGRPALHRVNNPVLGGGALLDLGVYPTAFVLDLLGEPERIQACAVMSAQRVDCVTSAAFVYPSGAAAAWTVAINAKADARAVVAGSEARIEIGQPWHCDTDLTCVDNRGDVIARYGGSGGSPGLHYQARAMEALVAGEDRTPQGAPANLMPVSESVRVMRCLDSIGVKIGLTYPSDSR
jgi:predicted dehydrogenase